MIFRPTSIPWFLMHELRLAFRKMQRKQKRDRKRRRFSIPPMIMVPVILLTLMVLVGYPWMSALPAGTLEATPILVVAVDVIIVLILTLMLSQTIISTVDVFYERGDLDLLLSSPVSPTRILIVRVLALAVAPFLLFAAIFSIVLVPGIIVGHPELIFAFVTLASMALVASALGLALALLLFSLIGPKRTRNVAQIFAGVVGASFAIVSNVPNFTEGGQPAFWMNLTNDLTARTEPFSPFISWPAESAIGHPGPTLAVFGFALAFFAVVAVFAGRRFARDAAAAQGRETVRRRPAKIGRPTFGLSAFRAIVRKEARLIRRDAALVSQVLLRVFYLIPLTLVLFTSDSEIAAYAIQIGAGAVALLAGQLAGSLAWITLSAEDSPELLASAPVPISYFWRAKLAATLIPPLVLVILPVIAIGMVNPLAGLLAMIFAVLSSVSAGLINLWLQKTSRRTDFRRSWNSSFAANMLELIISVAWAAAAGLTVAGSIYALVAIGLALVLLAISYRSEDAILARLTNPA